MKIPYLTSKKLANKEIAYYFNLPARLIPKGCPIKSQPLGKDYISACQKALELYQQTVTFRKTDAPRLNPKTIRYLWQEYQSTRLYKELKSRTQVQYLKSYEFLKNRKNSAGTSLIDVPLDLFDWKSANKLYERFLETINIFDTKRHFAFLRLIYKFGTKEKIFPADVANPFANMRIKLPKPKRKSIPHEDVMTLIQKARELEYEFVALALELNYYLCQRPADIFKLRRENIYQKGNNYFISFHQNKTGEEMHLPIPPQLEKEILNKRDYLICDENGPFSVDRFSRYFKKVNNALGFDYTFRLMRHTGGTAYVETGATTTEAIAFTGHKEERIFNEVYKSPSERMALNTLNKRLAAEKKGK